MNYYCWEESVYHIVLGSAYGSSQLKHQKVRVGSSTKEMLEWFNYLVEVPNPDAKLAARRYQVILHHHFTHVSLRPA